MTIGSIRQSALNNLANENPFRRPLTQKPTGIVKPSIMYKQQPTSTVDGKTVPDTDIIRVKAVGVGGEKYFYNNKEINLVSAKTYKTVKTTALEEVKKIAETVPITETEIGTVKKQEDTAPPKEEKKMLGLTGSAGFVWGFIATFILIGTIIGFVIYFKRGV